MSCPIRNIEGKGATRELAHVKDKDAAPMSPLRTASQMMNIPGGQNPAGYINNSILHELKKTGFIDNYTHK